MDGTQSSLEALEFAAGEASKDRAEDGLDLVVVHVRHLPWAMSSDTLAPVNDAVEEVARDAEDAVKRLLEGAGVTWRG